MAKSSPDKIQTIPTEKLKFDPENPRFYRMSSHATDAEVVDEMLEDERVQDIMLSIGQKGYFPGEPLLVTGPDTDGFYLVIEGNRRLTATKLLNGQLAPSSRREKSIETIKAEVVVAPPFDLPCLVYSDRKDILRYLGYRHITGIKEWDSLSKAKYLAQLRDEFYNGLNSVDQFKSLAKDIGSRSDYVSQLLTALNLYAVAERERFFGLPIDANSIEFSYITTALNYKNICVWLGLENKADTEMADLNVERLRKLFAWMFSKDTNGYTVLGETRNLSEMADIVASADAEKVLDETGRRDEAYLYTDGPLAALTRAIDDAQAKLNVVWKMFSKPTLVLSPEHLDKADTLFNLSKDIRNHVRNKVEE